jgi:hypothetical protein
MAMKKAKNPPAKKEGGVGKVELVVILGGFETLCGLVA